MKLPNNVNPELIVLNAKQLAHVLDRFEGVMLPFTKTIELPLEVGPVTSPLYGPEMGDDPVPDFTTLTDQTWGAGELTEVPCEHGGNGGAIKIVRGARLWATRMVKLDPARETFKVTIIATRVPKQEECVLALALGGAWLPPEPGDPRVGSYYEDSVRFWRAHALACTTEEEIEQYDVEAARRAKLEAVRGYVEE